MHGTRGTVMQFSDTNTNTRTGLLALTDWSGVDTQSLYRVLPYQQPLDWPFQYWKPSYNGLAV